MSRYLSLLFVGVLLLLVAAACEEVSEGEFLARVNANGEWPESLYMVVSFERVDIPPEKREGSGSGSDYYLMCELYEMVNYGTQDPHGKYHYGGQRNNVANPQFITEDCSNFASHETPTFVVNYIPERFHDWLDL